jgi:hypothetical protein
MSARDVLIEHDWEIVPTLGAWSSAIADTERRVAASLAELDERARDDEVSAGKALADHALRVALARDAVRVRQERADMNALCATWSTRSAWRALSRSDVPTPSGERTPIE